MNLKVSAFILLISLFMRPSVFAELRPHPHLPKKEHTFHSPAHLSQIHVSERHQVFRTGKHPLTDIIAPIPSHKLTVSSPS